MSTVLDSDEIDCVLDDGRRYRAKLAGVDPRRELAVITIAGEDLPFFALLESDRVAIGTRIFAALKSIWCSGRGRTSQRAAWCCLRCCAAGSPTGSL